MSDTPTESTGVGSTPEGWTYIPVEPDTSTPALYDFWNEGDDWSY